MPDTQHGNGTQLIWICRHDMYMFIYVHIYIYTYVIPLFIYIYSANKARDLGISTKKDEHVFFQNSYISPGVSGCSWKCSHKLKINSHTIAVTERLLVQSMITRDDTRRLNRLIALTKLSSDSCQWVDFQPMPPAGPWKCDTKCRPCSG